MQTKRTANRGRDLARLKNGTYKTKSGSRVTISGKHSGISRVNFDWFEEDACFDCEVSAYPEEIETGVYALIWTCEICGGGHAELSEAN